MATLTFERLAAACCRLLLALPLAVGLACSAHAEAWPARPVKIVVPYPAGGATDAIARLFAAKYQERTGVGMIVENRGGAGGNIGADAVAKAEPDGYTLLITISGIAVAPALYRKLAYDADNDLVRVTQLVSSKSVLVVNPQVPARSFQELVSLVKSKPDDFNYGTTGVGSMTHLGMELMKRQSGTRIQMVPFTGDAPLFTALLRNDVQMGLLPVSIMKEQITSGAVRPIGVATPQRLSTLPGVPTLAEQGLEGFDSSSWIGLFAPRGTPREVIDRLYKETRAAFDTPEFVERLEGLQLEPVGSTPEAFEAVWRADRARYTRIVRDANIPLQ